MTKLIRNLPTDYTEQVCKDELARSQDLEHFLITADANEVEFNEDGTVYKW